MAFKTIKDLLGASLSIQNDWHVRLTRDWAVIVGDLHQQMRLERINEDTILVGVYDSHWMHELYMLSPLIMQNINEQLGGNYVVRIRFITVERNLKKSQKKSGNSIEQQSEPRDRSLCDSLVNMTSRQEYVLRSVKDVQLQEVLKKVFYHCVV